MSLEPRSHTLYRFFDEAGTLLYIGRTVSPAQRWRDHERKKPWFNDVAKVTRQVYETAEILAATELAAIRDERPLYNVAGNMGRHTRVTPPTIRTEVAVDWSEEALVRRWDIWGVPANPDHLADLDETLCECRACHNSRVAGLDELEDLYGFHPGVRRVIEKVRDDYSTGAWLSDWYYDYGDLDWSAPMAIQSASREMPVPTWLEAGELVSRAWCPACPDVHNFVFRSGSEVSAVSAPCGAVLELLDDGFAAMDARYEWGDRVARRGAA